MTPKSSRLQARLEFNLTEDTGINILNMSGDGDIVRFELEDMQWRR